MRNFLAVVFGTVKNFFGAPSIVEVAPGIFAGNRWDACNWKELEKFGITTVINVADEINDPQPKGMLPHMYKVGLREVNAPITHYFLGEIIKAIKDRTQYGNKVLVHCWFGENRTPWVIAHYMAGKNGTTWQYEFEKIRAVRPECYVKAWMF